VGVDECGTTVPKPPDPPPRPSPGRNRVYAGFGHSIKRSKSATADFDWGREKRWHRHGVSSSGEREQLYTAPRIARFTRFSIMGILN